jgi:hypothetical protein
LTSPPFNQNGYACSWLIRNSPQVTQAEIQELKPQVPDWMLAERESIQQQERVFPFRNLAETLCLRIAWALSPRLKAIIRQQRLVEPKTKPQVETRGFAGVANEHKIRVIIEMQFGNNWSILHI